MSAMDEVFGPRKNRPDHPDFWALSQVMLGMDAGFDETTDEDTRNGSGTSEWRE